MQHCKSGHQFVLGTFAGSIRAQFAKAGEWIVGQLQVSTRDRSGKQVEHSVRVRTRTHKEMAK